ncbi:androgen-induced gene 1 protein isoform X1 [Cygnus atratus]|uniref:androgen-induced gene 1 protein isoform X1 n=1 Tax=Cygnus atratus TaxID=8868 RepID=UPI0015D5C9CE|nr:androgen-induced gene 1 protein isoform X1 [Cygnus atratus]
MALVPCQVLRAAILLSYCSILCNYKAIDMPAHQTYGGSWKFLTFIDLVIQAVFFGICVLTDLSSLLTKGNDSQEQERQLKKLISLRDWMMAVLAFPIGVFVVTMFWSIYIYDRELVYPKLLDNFIPAWLNHGMACSQVLMLPQVLQWLSYWLRQGRSNMGICVPALRRDQHQLSFLSDFAQLLERRLLLSCTPSKYAFLWRSANPSRSQDYIFQDSFSMRSGGAVPCPPRGPAPRLCALSSLGSCPSRRLPPRAASSLLRPTGLLQ